MPSGGELLFCAHHGRVNTAALEALDAQIQDQSEALTATPASAPDDEH